MYQDAYLVSLSHPEQDIPQELLTIASDVRRDLDVIHLIYRDPLNAFKLASVVGGKVFHGSILPDEGQCEGLHFPSGHVFLGAPASTLDRQSTGQ